MPQSFTFTFPALRGIQAGREYYVAMCPLKVLPRLFLFDEAVLPPELRAQRTLNVARIPDIASYIVSNQFDYAFSAITASIDGIVEFRPACDNENVADIGQLIVPMSARFVINDGQHRRAAIESALEERPELGDETIAVVFYIDEGLKRSQQLFSDLNKHAVKPTKSIGILYDNRDPLACLARELAETVPIFRGLTEKEKTTISNRSIKLFTLSAIYQATGALLNIQKGESISGIHKKCAHTFWNRLLRVIPEWKLVAKRRVSSAELREEYVHVHSVLLHALGIVGHALMKQHPENWEERLTLLREVDWSRSNLTVWEGRAMSGGKISKARQNQFLTTIYLKMVLNLELTPKELKAEASFQASRQYLQGANT